jgi:hypothetical protein
LFVSIRIETLKVQEKIIVRRLSQGKHKQMIAPAMAMRPVARKMG